MKMACVVPVEKVLRKAGAQFLVYFDPSVGDPIKGWHVITADSFLWHIDSDVTYKIKDFSQNPILQAFRLYSNCPDNVENQITSFIKTTNGG